MYAQPVYTVKLMQAIHRANQEVLSQHRVEGDHMHLPISVTRNERGSRQTTVLRTLEWRIVITIL